MIRVPTVASVDAKAIIIQDILAHRKREEAYISLFGPYSSVNSSSDNIALGIFAAVCAFALLATVLVLIKLRQKRSQDKCPLVDNEVDCNVDVDRLTIHV